VRLVRPQRYGLINHTDILLSCHEIRDLQTAPRLLAALGICGDPWIPHYPLPAIKHEISRQAGSPSAHKIGNAHLGIGINGGPGPGVSPPFGLLLWTGILLLGSYKYPNFVTLETADAETTHVAVMIFGDGTAQIAEAFPRICSL